MENLNLLFKDFEEPIDKILDFDEKIKKCRKNYKEFLEFSNPYLHSLFLKVEGEIINYHTHLDRAFTLDLSLKHNFKFDMFMSEKQKLIVKIQDFIYSYDYLKKRIRKALILSIIFGVRKIFTGANILYKSKNPHMIIETLNEMKKEFSGRIDLVVLAYFMSGFKDSEKDRWETFTLGAKKSDGILTLPELDSRKSYNKSIENIGFKASIQRTIELAIKENKQIHIHIDQKNEEWEAGSQIALGVIEYNEKIKEKLRRSFTLGYPLIYFVHAISTSCKSFEEQEKIAKKMAEYNIGLIVCPTASLGMKQGKKFFGNTHNSIVSFDIFYKNGVKVFMGCDNVYDQFIPNATFNMMDEVNKAMDGVRNYDLKVYEKILKANY